ncbi:MAG: hypothetical protein HN352_01595 [Bacteroidetes bacterium]|nr:hypothetical protein [Bacteroidota bacterium]MBT3747887.1 hypothetical protein [Bacteroidota bacterium]MBT4399412.1 hypothetical protein [Bacteroidota bacterium]MBT4412403.1 hypothetical protein [Bacteroidota bacterium]MBT7093840.1 hypothetical protein [Bacteroidota bacterium]
MKSFFIILILLLGLSCAKNGTDLDQKTILVQTICNEKHVEVIDLSLNPQKAKNHNQSHDSNYELVNLSGNEIVESIELSPSSDLSILTRQLGIAKYQIIVSKNNEPSQDKNEIIELVIISHFLLDFTQRAPFEPRGSVQGINYPDNSLVEVAEMVVGVDENHNIRKLSPGLLVQKRVAPYPHNKQIAFPDFDPAIKYFGYKENEGDFKFRYEPIIPMLEVGDGTNNRGTGIIVINKNQIQNDSMISFKVEAYCSIRTRTDDAETYNLGMVIGAVNETKVVFKDAIVARDYFNIGYSSSGQVYSNDFNLDDNDYLSISIIGEAGIGRDKNRTTRLEYIKITPTINPW